MLKKVIISNFKGFERDFILNLSDPNGYVFNANSIQKGIANHALIYGPNGCGKSNLGLAIFDIIEHLTDKYRNETLYEYYLNADSKSPFAEFHFEFFIENKTLTYEYKKTSYHTLIYEKLSIDKEEVVCCDRTPGEERFTVKLKGAESLNTRIPDPQLSALKYIKNNTVFEEDEYTKCFLAFFAFVEGMLFFRALQGRTYLGGFGRIEKTISDDIIDNGHVNDFEDFLNRGGVECKLAVVEDLDKRILAFDFKGKKIPFLAIASAGTNALSLFYFWYQSIKKSNISFVFIDEFDAFYHHELSTLVVEKLKETGVQFMLTTHNTSLLSNEILRPDCNFLMSKKTILPVSKTTLKELREAHNIEKMYKAGSFHVL